MECAACSKLIPDGKGAYGWPDTICMDCWCMGITALYGRDDLLVSLDEEISEAETALEQAQADVDAIGFDIPLELLGEIKRITQRRLECFSKLQALRKLRQHCLDSTDELIAA